MWPNEFNRFQPGFDTLLRQYQELNAAFEWLTKSRQPPSLQQLEQHRGRLREFRLALRKWRRMSDHDVVATEHLIGDGWLHCGTERIGRVSYRIGVARFSHPSVGTELHVELSHHSIDPGRWQNLVVSLHLADGRQVLGFLSFDGSRMARTGTIAS